MNFPHFWTMLRYEIGSWRMLSILFYPVVMIGMNAKIMSEYHYMFSLNGHFDGGTSLFVILFAANYLFLNGTFGFKSDGNPVGLHYNPEFFFTRAIARRSQFYAKACLYLGFACLTSLGLVGYSCTKPAISLELPYNTAAYRETVKSFYLTQFKGSVIQKEGSDKEGNKSWVILPHGNILMATFDLVLVYLQSLIFLFGLFLFRRKVWCLFLMYIALLIVPLAVAAAMWGGGTQQLSLYERGFAWTINHPAGVLGLLLISTVMVLGYCAKQFIRSEVVS